MHRILLLALAFASSSLAAQPSFDSITTEVTDDIAAGYAECAAFFLILKGASDKSGKLTESAKFEAASGGAAEYSFTAAKRIRSENMASEVTLARVEMFLKDMYKTIDNNYSNMSLLVNRHLESCTEGLNNSAVFIKRRSDRINTEHGIAPNTPSK